MSKISSSTDISSDGKFSDSNFELQRIRQNLISLLNSNIKRLLNIIQRIIEKRDAPHPNKKPTRIDILQFTGFRNFAKLTTVKCTPVTLIIGKNNSGKSNILEAFRLCTTGSLREFLLDWLNGYGSESHISGFTYIFTHVKGDNYYYPSPMRMGFKFGASLYSVVIGRHSPFLFIEWYKNQERLCTLVATDNLSKAKFYWGDENVIADGRKLTKKFASKDIENDFEKLRLLMGEEASIAYNLSSRDERLLLDHFEEQLAGCFSKSDVKPFLSRICSYFGIPALMWMGFTIVNYVITPTSRHLLERGNSFKELTSLGKLIREYRKSAKKKKLLGQVITFIDEMIKSYDPSFRTEKLGTGGLSIEENFLIAKSLGSGYRSILLLCLEIETKDIILIDEPETFLHPSLQAKLAQYILEQTRRGKQFIIASHSEVLINTFFGKLGCSVIETQPTSEGCQVIEIRATCDLAQLLDNLGLKASYLLQSNAIIWVEGPSDRIYINHWIDRWSYGKFKEGVHYHCLPYGGRLLSHFSANKEEFADAEKIAMLQINRHAIIVIDSDKRDSTEGINSTKNRLITEISEAGGLSWVTYGRTIENYVPLQVLQNLGFSEAKNFGIYDKIDDFLELHRIGHGKAVSKIELAKLVTENLSRTEMEEILDLKENLDRICLKISIWNNSETA